MEDIRSLNVAIELWGVAFCLMGIICSIILTSARGRYRSLFVAAFAMELVSAGGDAIAGIYRGQPGDLAWIATHVGNCATFIGGILLVAILITYLCSRIEEAGGKDHDPWVNAMWIAAFVLCILAVLGVFFHIDEGNIYHRSNLYWIPHVYVIVVSGVGALLVLLNRKRLSGLTTACLLFYTSVPIAASIAQTFVYGLNFSIVAGVAGLLVLFLEQQVYSARELVESTEALARMQIELSESRMETLMAQIHPDFLFSTLEAIRILCDKDNVRTKAAIESFSHYLQMSLDDAHRTDPISIESEMEHAKTFLELEQLLAGDRLNYQLIMPVGDFMITPLCVQTLVQNAVWQGLAEDGESNITVCTGESRNEYWVSVVDIAGRPTEEEASDEQRLAIANLRSRIEAVSKGTLDLTCSQDEGTIAIIHIPKHAAVQGERL